MLSKSYQKPCVFEGPAKQTHQKPCVFEGSAQQTHQKPCVFGPLLSGSHQKPSVFEGPAQQNHQKPCVFGPRFKKSAKTGCFWYVLKMLEESKRSSPIGVSISSQNEHPTGSRQSTGS